MIPCGLTIVREWRRLHYPLGLVLRSFGPLGRAVVVLDTADPDLGYTLDALPSWVHPYAFDWATLPRDGNRSFRQMLERGLRLAVRDLCATHVLHLDADEVMHCEHVEELCNEGLPVAWLPRLTLWRDLSMVRLDWGVTLPRWATAEALKPALTNLEGDASQLPVKPEYAVQQCPQWPILHLSRVGSPKLIAQRRRAVARLYAPEEQLQVPDVYQFEPRRYENWAGAMPPVVAPLLATYLSPMPGGVDRWEHEDKEFGAAL